MAEIVINFNFCAYKGQIGTAKIFFSFFFNKTEKYHFFNKKSENLLLEAKSTTKCKHGNGFSSRNRFLALSMSYGVVFRVKSGKIKFRNFEKHVF